MKYLGEISDPKDMVTKEYVDGEDEKTWSLVQGIAINTAGADLNTYKTVGNYNCHTDAIARTLLNKPSDLLNAFAMKVWHPIGNGNYIAQEIIVYYSGLRYFRLSNNSGSSWGGWYKYPDQTIYDTRYVKTSGNETVAGNKNFTGITTITPDSAFTASTGTAIAGNSVGIIDSPIPKYLWHDLWAFCRVTTPKFYTSSDGTTWVEGTLNKNWFAQKESWGKEAIISDSTFGVRWEWSQAGGLAWSSGSWLVIANGYTSPQARFDVLLEQSDVVGDSAVWSTLCSASNIVGSTFPWWIKTDGATKNAVRLTLTRNTNSVSGSSLYLVSLKWLTHRWGGQGRGSEFEHPYTWDANYNISPLPGSKFIGDLTGTASSATKAATLTNARTIDGVSFNGSANISHFGSCTISGRNGTVSCTGFTLTAGAWIAIYFPTTNNSTSSEALLLNVNNTGGKEVKYYRSIDESLPANAYVFSSNRTYLLVYDGTNYRLAGDLDTTITYDEGTAAQLSAGSVLQAELWSPKVLHDYINPIATNAQNALYIAQNAQSAVPSIGTAALLAAGTDTTNRSWTPKILHDYIESGVPTTTWERATITNSTVTFSSGGHYVSGRHCYVQMQLTTAKSISANTVTNILSGMPAPTGSLAVLSISIGNKMENYMAQVTTGGVLRIRSAASISSGATVNITGVYTIS